MIHRHIITTEWTLMAIESLFDRGDLADWREFAAAIKTNRQAAADALRVCGYHRDAGAKAIARIVVEKYQPGLVSHSTSVARG